MFATYKISLKYNAVDDITRLKTNESAKMEKNVKYLHWYSFWDNFILFYPIKILFFAQVCGDFVAAMSLFAIQNISVTLLEIPTGCLSDRWGRKWVCCAGAASMLLSVILYAVAHNYFTLVIASVLNGLYHALESGNNNALLYDSLVQIKRKQDYHREISKNTSLGQLSLAIGSLAGMAFVFISLRAVMIAAIIPAVIAFAITLRLVEAKKAYNEETTNFLHIFKSLKYLVKHKRLSGISLAETLHYGLNEAAFDFNAVFFKQFVPEWSLGIFRSIGHFANSLGNYLSFFAAKRWGLKFTILFGVFFDNFSNIISVLAASVWSPVIKIVSTFCSGLKEPAEDTLIQNDCNEQERATLLSIISLFGSLFYSLCAVLIGMLADMTSPYTAMLCFYILALTSNSLFFVALKNTKK